MCAIMKVQEIYAFFIKNLALAGGHMYRFERYRQLGLADFNQPVGLKMNIRNFVSGKTAGSKRLPLFLGRS